MVNSELLKRLAPSTPKAKRDRFIDGFNTELPKYNINTRRRLAAFLATVVMESDYLRATEEYADGWAYDISVNPRKASKLGNKEKGDGPKYKGRSLIQTTGKHQYEVVSKALEYDFVKDPKALANVEWAVKSACVYWEKNKLNKYADSGNFFAVQGIVNRGSPSLRAKDYSKRADLYELALKLIPEDGPMRPVQPVAPEEPSVEVPVEEVMAEDTVQPSEPPPAGVADIQAPEPYNTIGFWSTIKRDLSAVFGGNFTFQGLSEFVQQVSGLPAWVAPIVTKLALVVLVASIVYLIFRIVHYTVDTYKKNQKVKLEASINADPAKKDINWV